MNHSDLSARIHEIIERELDLLPHAVRDDDRLSDLTDDFGKVSILMAVEDLADVEISDDDAERIQTVGDLVSYLAERLGLMEAA